MSDTSPSDLRPITQHRSFATGRAVLALMLREMATTYGRSPVGYLWALMEPIGGIALLTVIFSLGFRHPPLGTNFPIFYATGLVPFLLYSDLTRKLSSSLTYSRQLISYPCVTFIDALMARFLLNGLTQLLIGYMVFSGVLILFDTRTSVDLPAALLATAMAVSLGLGVGLLNCFLFAMIPAWMRIWRILNRPLLLISGVIFLFDRIPEPYQSWLWWNPLVHVIGQMRHAFYPYYYAQYVEPLYVFAVSLILIVLGLIFLIRHNRDLMNDL